jgi:hypothetical protein
MTRWVLFLTAVLFVATQAAAQQQPQPGMMPPPGAMPQIVAFDNDGLLGDHIHIFGDVPDLGKWGNSTHGSLILNRGFEECWARRT